MPLYRSIVTEKGNSSYSFESQEEADERARELDDKGCFRCMYCDNCARCIECTGCVNCIDCKHCTDCINCRDCSSCIDCCNICESALKEGKLR